MERHKNTRRVPVALASGRVLAPGEVVNGQLADPDRALVERGVLVALPSPDHEKRPARRPTKNEKEDS